MRNQSWHNYFSNGFLKAADVPATGKQVEIVATAVGEVSGDQKLIAQLDGEKSWVLNRTNCERLEKIFGSDEPDAWVGKVELYNDRSVRGPNGERGGIRVRPAKKRRNRPASEDEEGPFGMDSDLDDLED